MTLTLPFATCQSALPWRRLCHAPHRRASRRRHELGADGIRHEVAQDVLDRDLRLLVERPADDLLERRELLGAPRTPQRDGDAALVEDPSHREREDALAVPIAREVLERGDGREVLGVSRLAELRVVAAEVVAAEMRL